MHKCVPNLLIPCFTIATDDLYLPIVRGESEGSGFTEYAQYKSSSNSGGSPPCIASDYCCNNKRGHSRRYRVNTWPQWSAEGGCQDFSHLTVVLILRVRLLQTSLTTSLALRRLFHARATSGERIKMTVTHQGTVACPLDRVHVPSIQFKTDSCICRILGSLNCALWAQRIILATGLLF